MEKKKESACNAGNMSSNPGWGRPPGEERGNPLQYSCWRISWTEEPGELHSPWVENSWTQLSNFHFHFKDRIDRREPSISNSWDFLT